MLQIKAEPAVLFDIACQPSTVSAHDVWLVTYLICSKKKANSTDIKQDWIRAHCCPLLLCFLSLYIILPLVSKLNQIRFVVQDSFPFFFFFCQPLNNLRTIHISRCQISALTVPAIFFDISQLRGSEFVLAFILLS